MNLSQLQKQPWLITPEAFGVIYSAAQSFFKEGLRAPSPAASPLLEIDGGVGVVSVRGPMMRKPDAIDCAVFGACDTEAVMAAVQEAAARPDVEAIMLDIDSPGGSVNGTPELAAAVAAASKSKYVYAFSAGQMCSAAYWVASQCDAIYATPSARVGSIGVILPVIDSSEAFAQAGLKMEVFAAGKYKSAGTPGVPLTDDQKDWLQEEVDDIAKEFRFAVLARGRKIPDEAMEGQTFGGRRAMRYNLSGVVEGRASALSRLRQLHVGKVDTAAAAMETVEAELAQAKATLEKMAADHKAHEALLAEAGERAAALEEKSGAMAAELSAEKEAREQLSKDLEAARAQAAEALAKSAELEAAERDIEKRAAARAAQIVAETGTQPPARITPAGDAAEQTVAERFAAITDPTAQTAFWRTLSAEQKAAIAAHQNK